MATVSPRRIWFWGTSVIVGIAFLIAGIGKLLDPTSMAGVLHTVGFAPLVANLVSWCLPPVEIACGIALVCGLRSGSLFVISAVMLLAFSAFLVRLSLFNDTSSCQCFGRRIDQWIGGTPTVAIGRNCALLALVGLRTISLRWRAEGRSNRGKSGDVPSAGSMPC